MFEIVVLLCNREKYSPAPSTFHFDSELALRFLKEHKHSERKESYLIDYLRQSNKVGITCALLRPLFLALFVQKRVHMEHVVEMLKETGSEYRANPSARLDVLLELSTQLDWSDEVEKHWLAALSLFDFTQVATPILKKVLDCVKFPRDLLVIISKQLLEKAENEAKQALDGKETLQVKTWSSELGVALGDFVEVRGKFGGKSKTYYGFVTKIGATGVTVQAIKSLKRESYDLASLYWENFSCSNHVQIRKCSEMSYRMEMKH